MITQQPNYQFTLFSNLDRFSTLGAVGTEWITGAGLIWANGVNRIENINVGVNSATLHRATTILADKRYIFTMTYTAVTACQIIIATGGGGQDVYLFNAPASPSPKILTCTFKGYPASGQNVIIRLENATPSINFYFVTCLFQEVGSLRRVIQPGGWKSLSKFNDRLLSFWGFSETLEGAVDIFGDDFLWLKSYLATQPAKRFYCYVEIDNGVGYESYFTGLLDTGALSFAGLEKTYKGTFGFLKESEWSQFVSHLSTPLDGAMNKGINQEDVIDAKGGIVIRPPSGLEPRLNFKFAGECGTYATQTLNASQWTNVGFGDKETVNDGFETFVGLSTGNESIKLPPGRARMRAITGTLRVIFTVPAQIVCEAELVAGSMTVLTSNTLYAINLPEAALGAGVFAWRVRFRNTSGATANFTIQSATLTLSTEVEYELIPATKMPLMVLKAYAARILGEYDNIRTPVFEDYWHNLQTGADPDPAAAQFQSPPPRFRPYNLGNQTMPVGNFYTGNIINWTRLTAPNRWSASAPSNVLLSRAFIGGVFTSYTTYFTKGNWIYFVNGLVSTGVTLEVVGLLDDEIFILATVAYPGVPPASLQIPFVIDQYYEGVGLRVTAGSLTMTASAIGYNIPTPNVTRGKYAMNHLTNGVNLDLNAGSTIYGTLKPPPVAAFIDFGAVFGGLTKIFSLGMEPETVNGKTRIYMNEAAEFFLPGFGSYMYAEEFTLEIDNTLLADHITVGGLAEQETTMDQDSSCAKSDYSTVYVSTKRKMDLEFEICLNPAMILNNNVSDQDVVMLELSFKPAPGDSSNALYRTSNGLTIQGTTSPRQPNWLHGEGRILRRNNPIVSSMGTPILTLIGGLAATQVAVDAGDGLGFVSGADPIFAAPLFTPWLIKYDTAMTFDEEKQLIINRKLIQRVSIHGVERAFYLKSFLVNRSTGRALVTGWLKATGDFSLDFSEDFETTPLPIEL